MTMMNYEVDKEKEQAGQAENDFTPYPVEYINNTQYQVPGQGATPTQQTPIYNGPAAAGWYNRYAPNDLPNSVPTVPKVKNKNGMRAAVLAVLLVIGFMAGMLLPTLFSNNSNSTPTAARITSAAVAANNSSTTTVAAPQINTVSAASPVAVNGGLLSVTQVAQLDRPAVVQITNQQVPTTRIGRGSSNSSAPVDAGVGSGVIYDKSGYILTNYHVIDGAVALVVTLPDGRTFDGTVVGKDMQTDLAVVKIDPKGADLPVAVLGDSTQLKVGDGVVAIGNALALPGGPTVTAGVVSALGRSVTEPGTSTGLTQSSGPQLYDLVQTDAAINPGNSGGPLLDMSGKVIGINTLVAGQAEAGVQAQGIGFAISINQAHQLADQLVANGKVDHAFLGISFQPLSPAQAKQLSLDTTQRGAVLMQVQSGSPAAQAGLKNGDIVIAIDGTKITGESTLGEIISQHKPGDKVKLDVATPNSGGNGTQSRTVEVTLGQKTSS